MIKAVFLDIDDTILDFEGYTIAALKSGFKKFGLRPYEDWMISRFHEENSKLWRQIEQGTLDLEGLKKIRFNTVFKALGISFDGQVFENYFRNELFTSAIPVPGAEELLKELKGKYLVCTASNGPLYQQINRIAVAGWSDCFDYMFISEKFGVSKPAKEFYEQAFAEMAANGDRIRPEEVLMVGDSLTSDMAGGICCGMKTCWYNPKHKSTELPVDYTIDQLSEITRILGEMN